MQRFNNLSIITPPSIAIRSHCIHTCSSNGYQINSTVEVGSNGYLSVTMYTRSCNFFSLAFVALWILEGALANFNGL